MPIDADVLAVLQEVGTAFTIHKPDGTAVTGEYLDFVTHTEHTTPLIRSFFTDYNFHYPTQVEVGDIVEASNGKKSIILSMDAEMFENSPVDYLASGYKINAAGGFKNYIQDDGFDANYTRVRNWVNLYTGVEGCMIDRLFRSNVMSMANESMNTELDRIHLYVSAYYSNVKMGMRWETSDGEKFKVEQIEPYRFPGVLVVFLSEDTRA